MTRFIIITICAVCLFSGCTRTMYVPVETVRTEREEVTRWRTDTVTQGDTRLIYVKGDTVIDWRDRWRERVREVHDTVQMERVDTVAVPYPVERKLTRWERTKLDWGGPAIGFAVLIICVAVVWLCRRLRRG